MTGFLGVSAPKGAIRGADKSALDATRSRAGTRCVGPCLTALAHPRARATVGCAQRLRLQRLRPPFCSDLTLLPRGRYVNLAELGDEDRENKLETKTVEYLVHGLFARSEKEMGENKNGRHGAWWVDLDKILATIAADDLKQKLQAFEEAQKATRDEAIAAAMERKEEAAAADDSCSCHVHVCIGADITYQLILIS